MSRFPVSAAAALVLLASTTSSVGAGQPVDPFQQVAFQSGVPAPLLAAIGYADTHWQMYPHQSAFDGGWGMMQLTESRGPRSLQAAARLTGQPVDVLRHDGNWNLEGGARLLAQLRGPTADSLDGWRDPLSAYVGADFSSEVYAILRRGASGRLWNGLPYTLHAQAVSTHAPTPAYSPDNSSSAWVPAAASNYTADFRPYSYAIQLIVIHVTESSYGSAISTFQNPTSHVSAHYVFRSFDGASTQMVKEGDIAWHAGNWDYNTRAVGIEHEGYVEDPSWFTSAMYQASARLTAAIAARYSIPIDRQHIVGHDEVPDPNHPGLYGGYGHHTDPGPYWNWSYYMSLVTSYAQPCSTGGPSAFVAEPGAAHDVATNSGSTWVIGEDSRVHGYGLWHWTGGGWTSIPGAAVRLAVGPDGLPWAIDMNQGIFRWTGSSWQQLPGSAYDIGVGADGSVWVIGTDDVPGGHGLYRWNGSGWDRLRGGGVHVAVDPTGEPWVVSSNGSIWRHDQALGWVHLAGAALDISVAADGSAWVIGVDHHCGGYGIWRSSGAGFTFASGAGETIAAGLSGDTWTTTNSLQIWRR